MPRRIILSTRLCLLCLHVYMRVIKSAKLIGLETLCVKPFANKYKIQRSRISSVNWIYANSSGRASRVRDHIRVDDADEYQGVKIEIITRSETTSEDPNARDHVSRK